MSHEGKSFDWISRVLELSVLPYRGVSLKAAKNEEQCLLHDQRGKQICQDKQHCIILGEKLL